jgi:hypothetical protein
MKKGFELSKYVATSLPALQKYSHKNIAFFSTIFVEFRQNKIAFLQMTSCKKALDLHSQLLFKKVKMFLLSFRAIARNLTKRCASLTKAAYSAP